MQKVNNATATQLSSRPGYIFVRAALKIRQRYADSLASMGLLTNHHAILSTLHELGPCHQKELAHAGTGRTTVEGLHSDPEW